MPAEPKIRLLVVEDQEVIRLGLKTLLSDTEIKSLPRLPAVAKP